MEGSITQADESALLLLTDGALSEGVDEPFNSSTRAMQVGNKFHPLSLTTVTPGGGSSQWNSSNHRTGVLTSFAVIVSLITILANMTIIILASTDKKLRKMNSYFIINLACMDMIVGLFVIPCMAAYNILGYWPLGNFVCDLWTCIDFMCCTASFFNLCVISWDRFGAITKPLQYRSQTRGKLRIFGLILLPWLASGLSWVPAIAIWRVVLGYAGDGECLYLTDKYYILLSNIFIYCIPMAAIIYLYARVWSAVGTQMKNLLENQEIDDVKIFSVSGNRQEISSKVKSMYTVDNVGFNKENSDVENDDYHGRPYIKPTLPNHNEKRKRDIFKELSSEMSSVSFKELSSDETEHRRTRSGHAVTGKEMEQRRLKNIHLARMMTHRRTTKTLGIIVTVFLICWIPWTILYPLNGFCRCVPNWLYISCYWTAYLNSTFNPFLYGFNRDFRKAFKRIFIYRFLDLFK